jgi:glycosyltransferase involved in cell wall biosynthesis
VKLSVIVATKNRAAAIGPCLDAIAATIAAAAPLDAEIIVSDNGSTDATAQIIAAWVNNNAAARAKPLLVTRPGKSAALNSAILAAEGELLAFIDDDCRPHRNHISDLLRHAAADTEWILRGGRIDLGDPSDLPIWCDPSDLRLTINTNDTRKRWSRAANSARYDTIKGKISGCNMTMPRALVERLGPFDENLGPGSRIGSGDDTEYIFRAFVAGIPIEHVPDMPVSHFHGRKTADAAYSVWRRYMIGTGAIYAKYFFKHPNLCRPFYWDCKNALREIITGTNTCFPYYGFSHKHMVAFTLQGAVRYLFLRSDNSALKAWEQEQRRAWLSSPASREIEALDKDGYRLVDRDGDAYTLAKPRRRKKSR